MNTPKVVFEEIRDGMILMVPGVADSPEDQNDLAKIVRELRLHDIDVRTKFARIHSTGSGRGTPVMFFARVNRADTPRAKKYCHLP